MSSNNIWLTDLIAGFIGLINRILGTLGEEIKLFGGMGTTNPILYSLDYTAFANQFIGIFTLFAYSFAVICIGLQLAESALTYELFSIKGGFKVAARCLLAKAMIDVSAWVCGQIVSLGGSMLVAVINKANSFSGGTLTMGGLENVQLPHSDIWFIGEVVDFVLGLVAMIPLLLLFLAVIIAVLAVFVKLAMRSFEIGMMITVSPMFFACFSGGEVTRQYMRKFIVQFLSVIMQVVFMALVYSATIFWLQTAPEIENPTTWDWFLSVLPKSIILIAACIMMIKPPKALTSLISN
jgi:hypothetical protein